MNTTINNIKYRFKNAGIVEKLIYVNLVAFVITFLVQSINPNNPIIKWFALPTNFNSFIYKPWSIISYGFLHANFPHIFFNLVILFYIGNLFVEYFTQKQLLTFYLLGTFWGGLLFLLAFYFFPDSFTSKTPLVGASAGISAIILGITTYIPNYQLKLRFIGFVKLWHITAFWIFIAILFSSSANAGGNLAHIGGALFGFLYVSQASNKKITFFDSLKNRFQKKEKPLKTVHKSNRTRTNKSNFTKSETQQQIDAILDKIGKSGYDSLSKQEKEFLFKQGRN